MFKKNRRIGKFQITDTLLETEPQLVANTVFRDCIIFGVTCDIHAGIFEYVFYCPELPIISEDDIIPEYHCEINTQCDSDGVMTHQTRRWTPVGDGLTVPALNLTTEPQ